MNYNYASEDEKVYYRSAELTSQLDLCLRTLSPKYASSNKAITKVLITLIEELRPALTRDFDDVDLSELPKSPLYNKDYIECIETGDTFETMAQAEEELGLKPSSVYNQISGFVSKADGKYTFRYLE